MSQSDAVENPPEQCDNQNPPNCFTPSSIPDNYELDNFHPDIAGQEKIKNQVSGYLNFIPKSEKYQDLFGDE